MTAEQIAAKLTPAQVRALRDPNSTFDLFDLLTFERRHGVEMVLTLYGHTDLGRAVLAVLDGGKE